MLTKSSNYTFLANHVALLCAVIAVVITSFLYPANSIAQATRSESEEATQEIKIDAREQLYVYQLNWVRQDPARYQKLFKIPVDLSKVEPRQPLAINYSLMQSAKFRASEMAENNYFGHQSSVTRKWPNEIARSFGYELPKNFGDKTNAIESIDAGTWVRNSSDSLARLIIDKGFEKNPGHRHHLLGVTDFYSKCNEIGVGYARNKRSSLGHYWTIHATWSDPGATFLTGVVFNDKNKNTAYELREGLAGIPIQVDGQVVAKSNSAGGWVTRVEPGVHTVKIAQQESFPEIEVTVEVAQQNIQVDFLSAGTAYVNFDLVAKDD